MLTIWAVAQVGVTTIAATALGSVFRAARMPAYHPILRWAVQTAIGFLVLSYALAALARIHQATPPHLAVFFALLVAFV